MDAIPLANLGAPENHQLDQLQELVNRYVEQRAFILRQANNYSEAQLRIDFVNPLLKLFGWDVDNEANVSQHLREVLQEEPLDVEEGDVIRKKNPDYTLRQDGERRLFIEVKKPAVNITNSSAAAFQTKRYGWNARLPFAVLTNFEDLIIYDSRFRPLLSDTPAVGRYRSYRYTNFVEHFAEIRDFLDRDSIYRGSLNDHTESNVAHTVSFDEYFLEQLERWRSILAVDISSNNQTLDGEELNFIVQRTINRILFLRVAEDRTIEVNELLKNVTSYDQLKAIFERSDTKYNSGLFDFLEDQYSLNIVISSEALIGIFQELYYPFSSYDFSVVDSATISEIYESFLGKYIAYSAVEANIQIINHQEIEASKGVVSTPKHIAEKIVRETLSPLCAGQAPAALASIKVADICCGSGVFLICAYEYLSNHYLQYYIETGPENHPHEVMQVRGAWKLTLGEKRRILLSHIYGVDINPHAVEVAQFNLLLKLLENESGATVADFLAQTGARALPQLNEHIKQGNSLVDETYFAYAPASATDTSLLQKLSPFTWQVEFPFLEAEGGFDAIVGNPPYVRIQNMVKYFEEEITYFRDKNFGYQTAKNKLSDKYFLFIERALQLVKPNGMVGYIVPHKFFTIQSGAALRSLISSGRHLSEIFYFGTSQVFQGRSTYTSILLLSQAPRETFSIRRIDKPQDILLTNTESASLTCQATEFGREPWSFVSPQARVLFSRIKSQASQKLKDVAEVFVGLQTSDDPVFIIKNCTVNADTISFSKNGVTWEIEKEILKNCIYDISLEAYTTVQPNAFIIFPYTIHEGRAIVHSEDDMQTRFPLCYRYLSSHRDQLEDRSIRGGAGSTTWYQFGRSQSLTKFMGAEKLIWPVLSLGASYTLDVSNTLFTGGGNGPFYALKLKSHPANLSLYYIMAVLNNPVIEAMVKATTTDFRGDYYSHGKQFVDNLPIVIPNTMDASQVAAYTTIIEVVPEIIRIKSRLDGLQTPQNRRTLELQFQQLALRVKTEIDHLYQLSPQDYLAVAGNSLFFTQRDEEDE